MADLPRGTVTLLFTDIEGSTRLLQRLGERYAAALAAHQRLLRAAFAAHGGHEVDTQGDAFFVAFPRALDAVNAAVDAQHALTEYPWPEGAAVRVRMGLHTGEPTPTGERYVGLAVHRAARVGAVAHGGQVLLSAATQEVLRDRLPPGVTLRDLGAHHLKDFDEPERLYQLVVADLPSAFPPLKVADPAPLPPLPVPLAAEDTPLVGRGRERAFLRERLDAALAGRGGLVLVGGEAGIGKTALAEALAREGLERGAGVAIGRCYDLTETPPYGPWREALAALPASPDLPPLPGALGGTGHSDGVASQGELFARARAHLAAQAERRPLVLLLDDLHWADRASLDLLRSLARQLAALPILLLATYRDDELTRRHPLYQLLPTLVREARAAQLDLRALPDEAVRALVRARYALPEGEEARLVAYLRERAEGHPLFVGELLRTLEEEGLLRSHEDGWRLGDLAGTRMPTLLRQVIEGRLDQLGVEGQRLLAGAALIGQEAPFALWARVAEVDEDTLLDVVERAVEARLVAETPDGGGVRFAHALIREALYEGTPAIRRRRLHRQIGEALAATPSPDPDAVAHHFRQAGDGRAVEWLIKAGERAQWAYAWLTAAERFEAALALLEMGGAGAARRGELLLRLARVRRYADPRQSLAYADAAIRLAAEEGDRALAAYALANRGLLHCFADNIAQGLADMEAGVAAGEILTPADRERLAALRDAVGDAPQARLYEGSLSLWLTVAGRYDRAFAVGERVVADAPAATAEGGARGDTNIGDACFALARAHAALGRFEEARRLNAQARTIYRAAEHHLMLGNVATWELHWLLCYRADDPRECERLAAQAEECWARATIAARGLVPGVARLPVRLLRGEWAEVRHLALTAGVGIAGIYAVTADSVLLSLAHEQGDTALARRLVGEGLPGGLATEPGTSRFLPALARQRLAAALSVDARDFDTARAWLEAHDRWLAWSGSVLGRAEGQLGWAAYHRAAGDRLQARESAERALAHAAQPRQPLALLAAHRLLGELATEAGHYAEAQEHLDRALSLAEACAAPYERALTLLALAELRAASGEWEAARPLLDVVRAICAPLGAKPALARAEALVARLAARDPAGGGPP